MENDQNYFVEGSGIKKLNTRLNPVVEMSKVKGQI